jgi:hypothetical protein
MTALPFPITPITPTGQPDGCGQPRTAGQAGQWGDVRHTAAGMPIFVFNHEPWATLHLVTVNHAGERRHSWVFGSPARLVELGERIGVTVEVKVWWHALDETLPPVELLS